MIITGDLPLTKPQVDKLCVKINKMKHMEQWKEKVEKLIRQELKYLASRNFQIKLDDQTKGSVSIISPNKNFIHELFISSFSIEGPTLEKMMVKKLTSKAKLWLEKTVNFPNSR